VSTRSEWLYVKLYSGRCFEDDLIAGPVRDFCERALATGAADEWFFCDTPIQTITSGFALVIPSD
jgi:hypothetical protein